MGVFTTADVIFHSVFAVLVCFAVILLILNMKKAKVLKNLKTAADKRNRELERQTESARAVSKIKSEFISRVSHEIRTPLNAIMGMTHMAQSSNDIAQIKGYLKNVHSGSQHLLDIVNGILDFSALEAGKTELDNKLFSLKENLSFLGSVFSGQAAQKKLQLSLDIINLEHDGIISDALRLNQILMNLLSNAIKFSDEGKVTLSVEELFYADGEAVYCFMVSDTGSGIAPEQASKLFTPFTQLSFNAKRHYGGVGLGLPIAKSLVSLFGGEIELDTTYGEGSTFSFTIRVRAQKEGPSPLDDDDKTADLPNLAGKHILIVDDITINSEIISAMLSGSGASFTCVQNGEQAVAAFAASDIDYFAMILMDIQMPVMDGYEATRSIRALDRQDAQRVVIAAVSASGMHDDLQLAKEAGMDDYLIKPIIAHEMYAKIGAWLEGNNIE